MIIQIVCPPKAKLEIILPMKINKIMLMPVDSSIIKIQMKIKLMQTIII